MRLRIATTTLTGSLLAVAGCSSASTEPATVPSGAASGGTTQAAAKHLTADEVAKALQARGLPVKNVIVYDENSDPNKRLGRPGQYSSKVNFADPRAKTGQGSGGKDVTDGGSVEVFDHPADALARGQYIQTVTRGIQILGTEYDYIAAGVLLRLSGNLPPSAARKYASALNTIVGKPIVTPSPTHT